MKFSLKLVLCSSMVSAVLFSCGGTLMIKQNFDSALETAVQQNSYQHTLERYSIESNMRNALLNSEAISDSAIEEYGESMTSYLGEQTRQLGIFSSSKTPIFSTITSQLSGKEIDEALSMAGSEYSIKKAGKSSYLLLSSKLDMPTREVFVLTAYDITHLFRERDRQLQFFLILDGIIVALLVLVLFAVSLFLTAPIKQLDNASRSIAQGAYHQRIHLRTNDEIGALGDTFNQMAQAVEDRIGQLNLALRQREDFVASFSHEIKTPMTAIIGYADLLSTACVERDKQLKYASYIYSEGRRLEGLAHKLMDLMALSDGNIDPAPCRTERFFYRLQKQLAPSLGETGLEIDAQPAVVRADEVLVHCLLRNLIGNAKKAEPRDGTVRVRGVLEGSRYCISVADRGCGIPEEELERITEPFYMVDKSRARAGGGSGLGLAICQKIAELHHTQLQFQSRVGEGTTVYFYLEVNEDA